MTTARLENRKLAAERLTAFFADHGGFEPAKYISNAARELPERTSTYTKAANDNTPPGIAAA